jgi:uncharacterized protein (DUF1501 family)
VQGPLKTRLLLVVAQKPISVHGGDFYGKFPTLALGGPDDATNEGRWIPTTLLDQYAATLANWFGVQTTDLPSIFPNLANFSTQVLNFVG